MFRASTDGGKTFGDKINLSNSTKSESQDAQIDASRDRVFATWWERNATSNEPLLRTSTDKGATFGPIVKLSANETVVVEDKIKDNCCTIQAEWIYHYSCYQYRLPYYY
jgi:hypothetical protein